jgi:hypothetical protein
MVGRPYHPIEGFDELVQKYQSGLSIKDLAEQSGHPYQILQRRLRAKGVLRSKGDAVRLAFLQGKMDDRPSRAGAVMPAASIALMRQKALDRGAERAAGYRINSRGYYEFTRGELAGRAVHVAIMEARLGRPLKDDECVHHIDGAKLNNAENNLALMTRAAHSRLHRREEMLSGQSVKRGQNGKFERKVA